MSNCAFVVKACARARAWSTNLLLTAISSTVDRHEGIEMEMKSILGFVFSVTTAITITLISSYTAYDWQWWAVVLPVTISGAIYGEWERKK